MIFTVGHSTRAQAELIAMLKEAGVALLVDVRRFPGSRRHPQFGQERLRVALAAEGIGYRHEPDLGGRREPRTDSPNTAWRMAAFRGYADHMASPQFVSGRERLIAEQGLPPAVMCAEALPANCHRQLIADALVARGVEVVHLLAPGRREPHVLHPAAVAGPESILVYPRPKGTLRVDSGPARSTNG